MIGDLLGWAAFYLMGFGTAMMIAYRRERLRDEMRATQESDKRWQIRVWQEEFRRLAEQNKQLKQREKQLQGQLWQ